MYNKSSLVSHRFHISKFAYLLKFTCNPKITTHKAFVVICGNMKSSKN